MNFGRALLFIVKLGILIAFAVWLANRPGELSLTWLGYRIDMPVGMALAGTILLLLLLIGIGRLAAFFMAVPGEIGLMHRNRRQAKGHLALTRGLAAAAGGDAREAKRLAHQATRLLGGAPIARLLQAQASQLAGDDEEAKVHFTALAENPETSILGLRGLASAALKRGDEAEALRLAERALGANANAQWAAETAMRLQAKLGRMDASATSLNALVRAGGLSAKAGQRRRAALLTEKARQVLIPLSQRAGLTASAVDAAALNTAVGAVREAVKLAGDFVPARFVLARLLVRQGKNKEAMRLIEQGWDDHPHPLLAALFLEAGGNERPIDRARRLERLLRQNPDHAESHRTLAGASLAAELWGEARRHLERLIDLERRDGSLTQGTCRLMARLEEAERGDVMTARRWLDEAAGARPDPAWICAQCGSLAEAGPESGQWQLCCPQCGALDTLLWRSPSASGHAGAAGFPSELPNAINRLAAESQTIAEVRAEPVPPATPAAEVGASVDAARLIN